MEFKTGDGIDDAQWLTPGAQWNSLGALINYFINLKCPYSSLKTVAQLWHRCLNLDIKPLKMVAPVPQLWHRCPNLNTKMLKIVAPVPQLWHRCLNLDITAIIYPEKLTWHRCHQHRYRCHHAGTGAVHWASFITTFYCFELWILVTFSLIYTITLWKNVRAMSN